MESIPLTTSDGQGLTADVSVPAAGSRGGAVVCHPHPQYGGDRFDRVVDAVFRRLPAAGFAALRFDFRSEFGGGVAERLDVAAGLDELHRRIGGPLYAIGYSFGASVVLAAADPRVEGIVAIAPPLAMFQVPPPGVPTLVLVPRHDQFTPPDAATAATDDWADAEVRVVESVDHFLLGRSDEVADAAVDWLAARH